MSDARQTVGSRTRGRDAAQIAAADPEHSVWVSANAGTGKTRVLIDRISRLLLAGTPPERILCLTFTKAAAAEMANRLSQGLGEWAASGDGALDEALHDVLGRPAEDAERATARRLFADTLEAPEGLRIRTIHSFCESLLGRFPLEAGVPPHFTVIDERTAAELRAEARDRLLLRSLEAPAGAEARALTAMAALADEASFSRVIGELDANRGHLRQLLDDHGDVGAIVAAGRSGLGLAPNDTRETVLATAAAEGEFDRAALANAAAVLSEGSKTDIQRGEILVSWLALDAAARTAALDGTYLDLYLTKAREPKAPTSLITKKRAELHPEAADALLAERDRMARVHQRLQACAVAEATEALLTIGGALLSAYDEVKRQRAYLDYDDLIERASDLLATDGGVSWVHYKLDGGIDHILVDEAQDTSPEQWAVVASLATDFFAGEGREVVKGSPARTIFAVGDEKQSIYSFQGADPKRFDDMRLHFASRAEGAGHRLPRVELAQSYRSTPAVLDAVDRVFAPETAADGLTFGGGAIRHLAARLGAAGRVEVWPTVKPAPVEETDPWDAPLDKVGTAAPPSRLAARIADTVADWLRDGEILHSAGRPVRPGDVMILVRTRGAFAEEMVRALKSRAVPVAGRDRMVLTDHLAVMDLIALGRFALLPDDDLNTAIVLKGPFVEMDEDALFRLASGRTSRLWPTLRQRRGEEMPFSQAHERLSGILARADFQPPYEFFARLLGPEGGLESLLAHLGPEAREPVEEFMSLALQFERDHVASLEGFLHWIETGETEVKRDLEHGHGEVRVMTVHGAKGLQANIVFLADTCTLPPAQIDPKLHWRMDTEDPRDRFVLWPAYAANEEDVCRNLRRAKRVETEREYRRLLYVALTRARDRVYVAGWEGRSPPPDGSWYGLVHDALREAAANGAAESFPFADDEIGYRIVGQQTATPSDRQPELPLEGGATAIPGWARRPPAPEPTPVQPLAPSRLDGDAPAVLSPLGSDDGERFKRGRIIHRLLQHLPDLDPAARAEAAAAFLARPVLELSSDAQADIASETLAVLADAALAPAFGPGSRAEVPLVGEVGPTDAPFIISAQVDRLVVTNDTVMIIDYKTNRPPPHQEIDVAPAYLKQMAAYRAALRRIYPDRAIEAYLLWTDGPRMMALSDDLLDAHAP